MTGANGHGADDEDEMLDTEEYNEMMLLDRLESLEDEMVELKVKTLDEVRDRIREMHAKLGE